MDREQTIREIAAEHLKVETLETRNDDGLDHHDLAVGSLKAALTAAYEADRASASQGGDDAPAERSGQWVTMTTDDAVEHLKSWIDGNLDGAVARVPLAVGIHALVDASDLPLVEQFGWSLDPTSRYAVAYLDPLNPRRCVRMHRLIMQARSDQVVDHINGDGLDNRRTNLRVCTQAENSRNRRKFGGWTSRYKGVSLARGRRTPWRAQIRQGGRVRCLGYFSTEEDAATAYDAAAKEAFGQFARLNFVPPVE